jgi:hypothetical protein
MSNTKRIEQLKQESKELVRQGNILEAVEKFNEAWELRFVETKPTIRPEIMAFAGAMEAEMARHDVENGDSWKDDYCDIDFLSYKACEHAHNLYTSYGMIIKDNEVLAHEAIDIANFAMMIWHKAKGD